MRSGGSFTLRSFLYHLMKQKKEAVGKQSKKDTVRFGTALTWTLVSSLWKEFTPTWKRSTSRIALQTSQCLIFNSLLKNLFLRCAFAHPIMLLLSYFVKNSMDRVFVICKLAMKWYLFFSICLFSIYFADDTNIFFSHKDFNLLSETLNSEMCKLTQWCRANKLSINFKKSNFMVFRPRQRRQTLDISIQIDNNNIDCVKEAVFFGVILDEHLSWKPHILSVSRKISKSIGIIYKSRFCLPKTSLHCLYHSLVYPYLIYCVSVWGSTYQSNLSRVFLLQKKIIRRISKVSFDSHTDVLFKENGILKFFDIYFYQIGKFMYLFNKMFTS